jgi:hypothetical protein
MEVDQEVVFPSDRHDHTDCFFFIHKSYGGNSDENFPEKFKSETFPENFPFFFFFYKDS